MDWRALLSKPPSKVVSRSPFSATKHEQSLSGAGAADQTHSTAAQQTDAGPARQQAEYVVPILLSKQAVVQITPAEKLEQVQEPQQQLRRLQELQQQTSSLLAAAAELAKQGERQQEQEPQHTAKQQEQEQPDPNDPYLRRPVPPPQHRLEQDECYFWSGSRMSAAAVAAAAAAAAVGGSSSDGGAVGEGGNAVSMDTSATTRMPHSQGHSELVSTAQSPSQSWASSLSRLKQLQLATREALLEGVVH